MARTYALMNVLTGDLHVSAPSVRSCVEHAQAQYWSAAKRNHGRPLLAVVEIGRNHRRPVRVVRYVA